MRIINTYVRGLLHENVLRGRGGSRTLLIEGDQGARFGDSAGCSLVLHGKLIRKWHFVFIVVESASVQFALIRVRCPRCK